MGAECLLPLLSLGLALWLVQTIHERKTRRDEAAAAAARQRERLSASEAARRQEQLRVRKQQAEAAARQRQREAEESKAVELALEVSRASEKDLRYILAHHPDVEVKHRARARLNQIESQRRLATETRRLALELERQQRAAEREREIERIRTQNIPQAVRLAEQGLQHLGVESLSLIAGFHPEASVRDAAQRAVLYRERGAYPEPDLWREQA